MGIIIDHLQKLEPAVSQGEIDPEQTVTAIIKVREPGYTPPDVNVRARIDPNMFTASFAAKQLKAFEGDGKIEALPCPNLYAHTSNFQVILLPSFLNEFSSKLHAPGS